MRVLNLSVFKVVALVSALIAIVAFAAACGDDDDDGGSSSDISDQVAAVQESVDSLHMELMHTSVYLGVSAMRAQDIHHLNLDVQEMASLDDIVDYETRLLRTSEAVSVTMWPDELQGPADDLTEKLAVADEAIESGDLGATKTAVKDVHDFWHILDADAATYLGTTADHENMDGMNDMGQDGNGSMDDMDQ
jgi:hypothetical protein